jgi:hypothetical protein
MLPPAERLPGVRRIVEQKGYFVIHAPRQTGKTTAMMALAHDLTASGHYVAVLVSMEVGAAFGSGRMDVCLRYGSDTVAMELKVWRDGKADPLSQGLAQLDNYLSGLGLESGWLIIFNRRSGQPPISERTTSEPAITPGGRAVTVIRA